MGICANAKLRKIPDFAQNDKEFESFDFSSPVGRQENSAIPCQNVHEIYKFETFLGSGGFGTVRIAKLRSNPQKKFAVKSILKVSRFKFFLSNFFQEKIKNKLYILRRELEILKQLDHPNIIKFHEIYQDDMNFHIIMEYCQGGELLKRVIEQPEQLGEQQIKNIFRKLLSAVNYMHSKQICHRDLKPQNILFLDNSDKSEPKIIDFGLSSEYEQQTFFKQKVGTLLYVAPEVLKGKYTQKCDIWSLGIILYILVTGEIPYMFETKRQLYDKVYNGDIDYCSEAWIKVNKEAKKLIKGLLDTNIAKRWTIQKCLENQWLMSKSSQNQQDISYLKQILGKLYTNFYAENRFKKEIMKLMIDQFDQNQLEELQDAFREVDKNCTGTISFQALQEVMKSIGLEANDQQIEQVFQSMHIENKNISPKSQTINYSEFVGSALACKKQISKNKLYKLFKQFTGKKDYFDKEDLKNFFARKGRKISQDIMTQMMQEVDINREGVVRFQSFLKIMEGEYIEQTANIKKEQQLGQQQQTLEITQPESFSDYANIAEGFKVKKTTPQLLQLKKVEKI